MASINLLDLPGIVLENIFGYCLKENLQVFQVSKFVKDFMENSSLMDRLVLNIKIDYKSSKTDPTEINKILQACINSTRKFKTIKCKITCSQKFWKDESSIVTVKKLFDKQASTARDIQMEVEFHTLSEARKLLCLLENMKNLESLECGIFKLHRTDFIGPAELDDIMDDNDSLLPLEKTFSKLKKLQLSTNFCGSLFSLLLHIKNLQKLSLKFEYTECYIPTMHSLIYNSRESLEEFSIELIDNPNADAVLNVLKNAHLNLKTLDLAVRTFQYEADTNLIKDLIMSQKHLIELTIVTENINFVDQIEEICDNLEILKRLKVVTDCNGEGYNRGKPWNIANLESLTVNFETEFGEVDGNGTVYGKILLVPNSNLKQLNLQGFDFKAYNFEHLMKNKFPGLQCLHISFDCENYQSDDIFMIFKHLKQLQKLEFHFPLKNRIKMAYVYPNQDLVLPNIKSVTWKLNGRTQLSYVVCYLTNFIQNASYLAIESDGVKQMNMDYKVALDTLTQKLPNLRELDYDTHRKCKLDGPFLQQITSNLQTFNKNPNSFKFNGKYVLQNYE